MNQVNVLLVIIIKLLSIYKKWVLIIKKQGTIAKTNAKLLPWAK